MSAARHVVIALFGLLCAAQAAAQSSHAGRWFQIEVIVFTQSGSGNAGRELPRVDTLPRPADLQFLRASESATGGDVDPARDPLVLLPREQRTLNHVARKLEQSHGYRVLYHGAWRQPVLLHRDAQPVYIRGGDQVHDVPELEGTLVPSVDFYLAAEVDLRLSEPGTGAANVAMPAATPTDPDWHRQAAGVEPDIDGLGHRGGFGQVAQRPAVDTVALQEKRGRMRSTELHYFDHPRLGMLIRFDRYSTPPVPSAAAVPPTPAPGAPQ